MADELLQVSGLKVGFSTPAGLKTAVNDVSIQLRRGETLGIVGESGSGKSVSMFSATHLLPRQGKVLAGEVLFDGVDILTMTRNDFAKNYAGSRISVIFQEPMTALNPVYTIGHQMAEMMTLHGRTSSAKARACALDMLKRVQMPDAEARLNQYPHQLSGGQRQRAMIAMALMNAPDLLIADEPTTALDVTVQAEILALLREVQAEFGMAMVFISHDLAVVSQMADRVVVMQHGEIVEVGDTQQVLTHPRHSYTRGLLSSLRALEGERRTENAHVTGAPLLTAQSISKRFRLPGGLMKPRRAVTALSDVSFVLRASETLGVVGESGSGKTTLSNIVLGQMVPDKGSILIDGRPVASLKPLERARFVQPVFQDPYSTLNPTRTLEDILAHPLRLHGIESGQLRAQKVTELMDQVGLPRSFRYRYPSQLSGGQRQRVAIARALAVNPQILICDEPTSALDVSIQEQVLNLLKDIQKEHGTAILLISHDMGVVRYMADRVMVMHNGKLVEEGVTETILKTPSAAYTKRLMQAVPHLPQPAAINGAV